MCEICKSLSEFPRRFLRWMLHVIDMMNDIGIEKKQQRYIIKKMINIAIRATYYIFCCRNRNWDSPDFCNFDFLFILDIVLFLFFFFLIIQSQAANCKLPIRSEIYNCTFKNTNKVSIIIIIVFTNHIFWMVCWSLPLK